MLSFKAEGTLTDPGGTAQVQASSKLGSALPELEDPIATLVTPIICFFSSLTVMENLLALRQLSNYAVSSKMPAIVQRGHGEGSNVLVAKSRKQLFLGIAVVKVSEFKLNCAANGNFIDRSKGEKQDGKR